MQRNHLISTLFVLFLFHVLAFPIFTGTGHAYPANFDGWRSFPIRSYQEFLNGDIGGEGLQHNQGIARSRSNPDIIYLSHDCGQVWRSTDSGETWKKTLGIGLLAHAGQSIEVDPVDPNMILVIMDNSYDYHNKGLRGIFRSTDGGENFKFVLPGRTFNSRRYEHNIAYDPSSATTNARRWYAALYDYDDDRGRIYIYRSEDGGSSWAQTSVIAADKAYNLQAHPVDGRTLYIATSSGMYVSRDRGANFTRTAGLPGEVTSIAVNGKNPEIIYSVASEDLYCSHDGGNTFSLLKDYDGIHVFINQGYPDRLFLVGKSNRVQSVISSSDGGKTWISPAVKNAPGLERDSAWGSILCGALTGIAPNAENPDEAVLFSKSYLWKTVDGGSHINGSSTLFTGYNCGSMNDGMAFDVCDPERFMFFAADTGPVITTTGGDWFEERDEPISAWREKKKIDWQSSFTGDIQPVAGSRKVVAVIGDTHKHKMAYTDNEGIGWSLESPTSTRYYTARYHRQKPDIVYAGGMKSENAGASLKAIDFGSYSYLKPSVFGVCEYNSDIIYAIDADDNRAGCILRSDDAGDTWRLYAKPSWNFNPHDGKATVAINPVKCDLVYAVDSRGDAAEFNGARWRSMGVLKLIDAGSQYVYVRGIKVDPTHPEVIYAGISGEGIPCIFRSVDYGYTWEDITYNYPRIGASAFSINPHTGEVFVSGCTGTRVLPPPYAGSTPLYDKAVSMPSCFDGLKNGDETSVDGGGSCREIAAGLKNH